MGIRRISKEEFNQSRIVDSITNLIKEVDSSYRPGVSEKKYYFDKITREVYENKPISLSKKDWTYYIIDFDEIVETQGLVKTLTELDNSCSLTISINYNAQIQQNPQKGLLKLLIDESNANKAINNRIIRWISAFSTNEPEFVKRFYSLKIQLKQYLEDEARKLGLSLDLAIDVKEEDHSKIVSGQVDVKVKDYQNRIPLTFELEVSVLEEKKVEGMQSLTNTEQLKEKVKDIISKSINSKNTIDLDFLHLKLNTGLRDILLRDLDVSLDRDGLKPEFLSLKSHLKNLPPRREQLSHSVKCITKNGYDIIIEHHLILNLKNLGDYFNSGINDVNQWVISELERITQDYIFEKDFTDLALHFEGDDIKVIMAKSVADKGYEIKQLITVPDLRDVFPKYFDFEVGNDLEFTTRREEVKVKLNVVINGKIDDAKKLAKYIIPTVTKEGIISKMKEIVLNIVRQFIHMVDPQMFYMYFDIPYNGQDSSLSDELKEKILTKLELEFGANNIDIILKQLETDLVKKFKALQGKSHPVYIENFTKQARFQSHFSIERVSNNGYHLFIAKCEAYQGKDIQGIFEEIARIIKNRAEIELNTRFNYKDSSVIAPRFINYILELLRKSKVQIEEEFGLIIKYIDIKRFPSKGELIKQKEYDEELKKHDELSKITNDRLIAEAKLLQEHNLNIVKKITSMDLENADEIIDPSNVNDIIKGKEANIYQPQIDLQEVDDEEVEIPNAIDFEEDVSNNKSLDSKTQNEKNKTKE
nr:hypothetical protein [uncultured Draconibacterium sp.]